MAIESAIVRIRKSNGIVVGAGFLVSQKHVITCAHVVADALGISRDNQTRPTEKIYLDFPLVAPEERLTARVVFWSPVPPKGSTSIKGKEDIAALEIYDPIPSEAEPVDLLVETDLRGHRFRTFGFPVGHDDGLEATGVVRGQQGTGWVQIEDVKETGVRLEPGFSGAPIWDEQLNGIVGMAVAADQKRPEAKIAFMIPMKVIASTWTPISEWTIPSLILTKKQRFRFWRDRRFILPSIALLFLSGGVFMTIQNNIISNAVDTCTNKLLDQETANKIVIANFDNVDINPRDTLRTEQKLLDQIQKDFVNPGSNIEVCLVNKIVINKQEAQKLGEDEKADVVIWGRKTIVSQNIYLEGIKEEIEYLNELTFPLDKALTDNVQNQDIPHLISVMVAFGLSINYYLNGQTPKAREILEATLELDSQKIGEANEYNARKIGDAYFLLGTMFESHDDHKCKASLENCRKALKYYKRSTEYNPKLYRGFLNKGILHEYLDEPDAAIDTYSKLIEIAPKSNSAVIGRFYRSGIYLNQKKNDQALQDLEIVSQREPEEIEYRHVLGLAQLKVGKIDEAKKTYEYVKKYISDPELKAEIIANLNSLSKETIKTETIKTISEIIATLQ